MFRILALSFFFFEEASVLVLVLIQAEKRTLSPAGSPASSRFIPVQYRITILNNITRNYAIDIRWTWTRQCTTWHSMPMHGILRAYDILCEHQFFRVAELHSTHSGADHSPLSQSQ